MKTTSIIVALLLSVSSFLHAQSPTGEEWQSPENLSLNKEQPRAHMFSFANMEQAKKVLPYGTTYYQSLDGTWKFHWVASPEQRPEDFYLPGYDVSEWDDIKVPGCWNVQGLQKDGTMKYGVPIYVNQPVIFYHEIKEGDWKEGVMRQPKDSRWTTYEYPNEVGSYRRTFTVPREWKGRHTYINFDGVDSFFYLWINGHYVGFSKNSRNTASFDITPYLQKGENTLAVEVYRSSDGSFLESQDMFRLPGIFRSTYLTSMPDLQLRDLAVRTESLKGSEAVVTLDAEVRNLAKKDKGHSIDYYIYQVALYGDETERLLGKFDDREDNTKISLSGIRPWSAEAPYRYAVVAVVKDGKGKVCDIESTYFGIRTVEIRQTPANEDEFGLAGRYFYVNNKPVKLKGVNRHETNPSVGHAITHEQMQEEVFLMKRGNINHIRMSHYSNDPYMYYLCDKYGIYLEDECNLESHQYYYGKESLSHPVEWRAAHIDRNLAMVHSHVNHPSIVIWSLGNEAGPGDNFKAAYAAIKAYDPSRPVQYERNNNIVDMGSNQYPSVDWVRQVAKGTSNVKYPFHISEYAHSMGNSLGNLVDYWEAMESTNFFCGGAIWDWVDQAIDTYTKDGVKYMGYGGDHGDWPNDGMFCMNGIMLPDLTPKPQYYEVKKVYQNVGVTLEEDKEVERNGHMLRELKIKVFNKNYFEPIRPNTYNISAIPVLNGTPLNASQLELGKNIAPRESHTFKVVFDKAKLQGELFLNVEFRLAEEKPWARAGYVQMAEQLNITNSEYDKAQPSLAGKALKVVRGGTETDVQGEGFHVCFDDSDGSIGTLVYHGTTLIEPGNGPKLDAYRAPVDNDNWAWNNWFKNGLYDLKHRTLSAPTVVEEKDGSVSVVYNVFSQAKGKGGMTWRPGKAGQPFQEATTPADGTNVISFNTIQRYTIYPDGNISVAASIISSDPSIVLPRLGYAMKLPKTLDQYTYYGRGPLNNYADRKTGSFVGLYRSTVKEQFVSFPKPQSMGNREDVRWCALQDGQGTGLLFVADRGLMSTSALPWSAMQMTMAAHPHELPESDGTYLHLDCQVTGLGGNSCGQGGPLKQDRVQGSLHQMKFIISPLNRGVSLPDRAQLETNVECPVSISRDRAGNVTIQGDENVMDPSTICYQITEPGKKGGKVESYYSPENKPCTIPLRKGGKVEAWYQGDAKIKTSAQFDAIETVPLEVVYVSSEEGPSGEWAKNIVDGDPSTIWHTMYSITVGTYPHWIDLDCNETLNIKGFTFLPRQDGSKNGFIKGYKIELSQDGKTWSEPVCQGEFENDAQLKKVMFQKSHKARYLRFTALSSQNGTEYASGAEISVIAE